MKPEPPAPATNVVSGKLNHNGDGGGAPALEAIPSLEDKNAERPPDDRPSLTEGAIDRRMRRVFTAKADGTFKVPAKFVEEFRKKGPARKSLEKILASCGYDAVFRLQQLFLVLCTSS